MRRAPRWCLAINSLDSSPLPDQPMDVARQSGGHAFFGTRHWMVDLDDRSLFDRQ